MINLKRQTRKSVKVTFSIPIEEVNGKASVVGDFNGWDPLANPLRKRGDVMQASVTLPAGSRHAFRYLADGGRWIDPCDAHGYEPNSYGSSNAVLDLSPDRIS